MCARIPHFTITLLLLLSSVASAGERRYFYHAGNQAYFCNAPTTYSAGYFAVCDDTSVVRINGCPTITTSRANTLCQQAVMSSASVQVVSAEHCGDPVSHDCFPRLLHRCHCTVPGKPVPITGTPGKLKTKCVEEKFYRGIEPRKATIPVPQICVTAKERYDFRPITLKFDCKDADCPDLNCDFSKCANDCCKVRTCEVYQCVTDCKLECKLVKMQGPVLIAVRAQQVGGQYVADVVIGRDGQPFFGAYPENTVILKAATQAQILARLGLNVDLSTIAGPTDIKSLIN